MFIIHISKIYKYKKRQPCFDVSWLLKQITRGAANKITAQVVHMQHKSSFNPRTNRKPGTICIMKLYTKVQNSKGKCAS